MAVRSREWPGCGGSGDPIDFLLERRLVTPEAAQAARDSGEDAVGWLFSRGHIGERDATMARAHARCIPFVDLDQAMILFESYHLPAGKAWELGALPIRFLFGKLAVAFRDPEDKRAVREVERLTGASVMPVATPPSRLDECLNGLYFEPELSIGDPLPRDAGEYLVKKGFVTRAQLEAASGSDDPVGSLLETDAIGEREFAKALAWASELAFWGDLWRRLDLEAILSLPPDFARQRGILPLWRDESVLKVAVRDPRDYGAFLRAEAASGRRVVPCFVMPARVLAESLDAN